MALHEVVDVQYFAVTCCKKVAKDYENAGLWSLWLYYGLRLMMTFVTGVVFFFQVRTLRSVLDCKIYFPIGS